MCVSYSAWAMSSVSCTSRPNCLEHTSCSVPRSNGSGGPFAHALGLDRHHLGAAGGAHAFGGLLGHRLLKAAARVVGTTLRRRPACDEGLAGMG